MSNQRARGAALRAATLRAISISTASIVGWPSTST
jgi:hypothetical protein